MSSNHMQAGEFCWNELMTSDSDQSKKFYGELFGWSFEDHDMGDMTYTMLKKDGKDVGGLLRVPKEHEHEIPSHWMSYVLVADVDASAQKAKSLGASIVREPTDVAEFGRFTILKDPTGAHIALWQTKKA